MSSEWEEYSSHLQEVIECSKRQTGEDEEGRLQRDDDGGRNGPHCHAQQHPDVEADRHVCCVNVLRETVQDATCRHRVFNIVMAYSDVGTKPELWIETH